MEMKTEGATKKAVKKATTKKAARKEAENNVGSTRKGTEKMDKSAKKGEGAINSIRKTVGTINSIRKKVGTIYGIRKKAGTEKGTRMEAKHVRKPETNDVGQGRRLLVIYSAMILICTLGVIPVMANGDPIQTVNNLSDFIFGLIRALGLILLGFGVVQIGLSFKSHDPSARANGFLTVAGGIVITFAREILNLIVG